MSPVLFRIGDFEVAAYSFFYGLGLCVAGCVAALLFKRDDICFKKVVQFWAVLVVAIVLGGRLLYAVIFWNEIDFVSEFVTFQGGGEVLYGALIVGFTAGYFANRILGIPYGPLMDAGAISAL